MFIGEIILCSVLTGAVSGYGFYWLGRYHGEERGFESCSRLHKAYRTLLKKYFNK